MTQSHALVPTAPSAEIGDGLAMQPIDIMVAGVMPAYRSNIDPAKPGGQMLLYSALNSDHTPFKSVINMELSVVGWCIRPSDERVGENGEVYRFPIVVLLLSDGRLVRAASEGVMRCIMTLAKFLGPHPWTPPFKCLAKAKDTGSGKQWCWLEPVQDAVA